MMFNKESSRHSELTSQRREDSCDTFFYHLSLIKQVQFHPENGSVSKINFSLNLVEYANSC